MSNIPMSTIHEVRVPAQQAPLSEPEPGRIRALKRHLIESLRDLREARRPDRLIQPPSPEPDAYAAAVVREGCTQCRGSCCLGGGTHAYLDERTMARVRRALPDLDAGAIIRRYTDAIAPLGYAGSCLFHGPAGCTLPKPLRAELCNAYYCNGLKDFMAMDPRPPAVVVVAGQGAGQGDGVRRSAVLAELERAG